MRIWSVHPQYLDTKGLVALWRETLLARKVLLGQTKGYHNHPQLNRFKNTINPIKHIDYYLQQVHHESLKRGYHFDSNKFKTSDEPLQLTVTELQMQYEFNHLLNKLQTRSPELYTLHKIIANPQPHPLFKVIDGEVESWEVV